jgi:glucosylceramidase
VSAITPQNEPGQDTTYPGGNLSPGAEASFITDYLRPALRGARLNTRIYGWDSNWTASLPLGPASLATGPAASFLSGMAWHCYYGDASVMSALHQLAPRLDQVVSECSQGIRFFSTSEMLIASLRNWATAVNLWNLALTPGGGPVQPPNLGCVGCAGILAVDPRTHQVHPTLDFYELAQVSHFVALGAVRLESTTLVSPLYLRLVTPGVDDVVFQNPNGHKVLIAFNSSQVTKAFSVEDGGGYFSYQLPPATTATFTW